MPKPIAAKNQGKGEVQPPLRLTKRSSRLLFKYGITEEQYDEIYRTQQGCCAVCKRAASNFKHRLAVDHDHKTGEIRGLLCLHCNRYVVGRHRRELGSELLKAAYEYLTREYPGWIVPPRKKKRGKRLSKRKRNAKKSGARYA